MEPRATELLILFSIGFLAAAVSGMAGFGGALLLLPFLTQTLGTNLAVPVLTIAQLIGNLSRVTLGFRAISWKPVLSFIASALPAACAGSMLFVTIDGSLIVRLTGAFIIIFVIFQMTHGSTFTNTTARMVAGGAITGFISGLIGSAGPIGAAFFLSLNLPPVSYLASEAVTAVFMHVVKLGVYRSALNIGGKALTIGLFIGAAMILGTWAGKKLIERIPKQKFRLAVGILLILVGSLMIVRG